MEPPVEEEHMNPQTNGATSRDWLEARRGMKIIAYIEAHEPVPTFGLDRHEESAKRVSKTTSDESKLETDH